MFNTILRSIQGRPYLGVAVASVEGIWEPGNKQARALAKAVVALASHARRIALFDDDGDPKAIEGLRRFLSEIDVTLNILARGDIEDYWLMDAAFLSRLIEESIAEATNEHNREIPPVGEAALSLRAEARSLGGAKKGADVLRSIFEKSLIRFDKIPAATVATRLMVEPVGAVVLKALSDDLRRTIEVPA